MRSASNGTLAVKDGDGTLYVAAKGALIVTFGVGRLIFSDPAENDTDDLVVKGAECKEVEDNKIRCSGDKVRYRVIGGRFSLRIVADNIDLSLVGSTTGRPNQRVELKSSGPETDYDGEPDFDNDDGDFKVNDDPWKSLPAERKNAAARD